MFLTCFCVSKRSRCKITSKCLTIRKQMTLQETRNPVLSARRSFLPLKRYLLSGEVDPRGVQSCLDGTVIATHEVSLMWHVVTDYVTWLAVEHEGWSQGGRWIAGRGR